MTEASQPAAPSHSFATPGPVDLEVRNPTGTIDVLAADTATSTVEVRALADTAEARDLAARTKVDLSGDGRRLTVAVPERRIVFGRGTAVAVSVTVPVGSRTRLKTASAESTCRGRLAELRVTTASGAVSAEQVTGDAEVRAASAAVRLGATGRAEVRTASGAVRIGSATGDVQVHVASGRVDIGTAEGAVSARSASGDISVEEASRGRVEMSAASGDLRIGVRAGVVARLDLFTASGRARSELPVEDAAPDGGSALDIRAKTVSGNVLVTRAAGSSL
jgi:DUF4097 and DUF4098 domain-containing protein YvlB